MPDTDIASFNLLLRIKPVSDGLDIITNEEVDYIVKVILMTGQSVFSSAFIARIFINLVDKGIAVLVAYFIYVQIRKKGTIPD